MNTEVICFVIFASLVGAVLLGRGVRRRLPDHHLTADTRDVVKLAMGLVATMSALLLGLLINSAKGSYDTARGEVIQMAAKISVLDRALGIYGAEAAPLRAQFRATVEQVVNDMWLENSGPPKLTPEIARAGDAVYATAQGLPARDEAQHSIKAQVLTLLMDLGQIRTLLLVQSLPSISVPLLVVVVLWLLIIFFSFSLLAPPNATATLALTASAISVAGAIFLMLELDRPFSGLIRIPNTPLVNALNQFGN